MSKATTTVRSHPGPGTSAAGPMRVLNLGCGPVKDDARRFYPDAAVVGLDWARIPGVDVVWDLEKLPLPFKADEFDGLYASHILEHMSNFFPLMREIHRVTKAGGKVTIRTPFYAAWGQFNDPTHRRFFTPFTFNYFDKRFPGNYYQLNLDYSFRVQKARLVFGVGKTRFLNWLMNPLINLSRAFYCRFFAFIVPAAEVHFELIVEK